MMINTMALATNSGATRLFFFRCPPRRFRLLDFVLRDIGAGMSMLDELSADVTTATFLDRGAAPSGFPLGTLGEDGRGTPRRESPPVGMMVTGEVISILRALENSGTFTAGLADVTIGGFEAGTSVGDGVVGGAGGGSTEASSSSSSKSSTIIFNFSS